MQIRDFVVQHWQCIQPLALAYLRLQAGRLAIVLINSAAHRVEMLGRQHFYCWRLPFYLVHLL